eukprot:5512579-Lingulodinium_polyedra.AAC.1
MALRRIHRILWDRGDEQRRKALATCHDIVWLSAPQLSHKVWPCLRKAGIGTRAFRRLHAFWKAHQVRSAADIARWIHEQ